MVLSLYKTLQPGILSSLEWKTFMLTWDSKRNRLSIFNENNKLLSVENINSLPKTNDEWRLTLSHERGSYRIRVHDCELNALQVNIDDPQIWFKCMICR